jgi:hypothetical protein
LRSHDPVGTVFSLSNDGVLPIHDITAGCVFEDLGNDAMNIRGIEWVLPDSFASVLSPGHKMTLPCAHTVYNYVRPPYALPPNFRARMTIRVIYRPDWVFWHKRAEFPLEAERTQEDMWIWKNLPR